MPTATAASDATAAQARPLGLVRFELAGPCTHAAGMVARPTASFFGDGARAAAVFGSCVQADGTGAPPPPAPPFAEVHMCARQVLQES